VKHEEFFTFYLEDRSKESAAALERLFGRSEKRENQDRQKGRFEKDD
jgi:hypothetical protein